MKKTLVVFLALVMVFSFTATAMAADTQYVPYTDIADQEDEIATAIERLSVLEALKGYNAEGTVFAPNQLITREEFATIGVRIAGLEDSVALYASMASAAKDVEEGRWSEGYVNCAIDNGIMVGRGNGVFDPTAYVTMQEVVTVLLRAVGYDDRLPGAWPMDYIDKATAVDIDLAEYIDFIGPKYATRAEVASMVNKALDLCMVYYVENEVAQGLGMTGLGALVDQDGYAYLWFLTNEDDLMGFEPRYDGYPIPPRPDDDDFDFKMYRCTNLLLETFDAHVMSGFKFWDGPDMMSEFTAWKVADYEEWELEVIKLKKIRPSYELATLYGISDGADLTDLGWQQADVTVWNNGNDTDEVCYIDLTSSVTRMADADEDYGVAPDTLPSHSPIWEGEYGEVWYDKDDKVFHTKNFDAFDEYPFGIVDSADEDEVDLNGYAPMIADIDLDDDVVFYAEGEGFIEGSSLVQGDVVYMFAPPYSTKGIDYYYVIRAVAGVLDNWASDSIEVDDVDYGAQINSVYSIDEGDSFTDYIPSAYTIDFTDSIMWAPSYAFVNFAHMVDNIDLYNYGILDSYEYDSVSSHTRIADTAGTELVVGMNVLLPGDTDLTTIYFKDEVLADAATFPVEGALIDFTLNDAGKCVNWIVTAGHDWYETLPNSLSLTTAFLVNNALTCDEIHGINVNATWGTKGRLEITMDQYEYVTGSAIPNLIEYTPVSKVYTFDDDAVIFLVESNELAPITAYDFDESQSLTLDEFKEKGNFNAADLCIYTADADNEISVLYVRDIVEAGVSAYGFGLYNNVDGHNATGYYVEIDGVDVYVEVGVYDDVVLAGPCLFAYKTTGGVVEDVPTDFVIIDGTENDTQIKADITAYYQGNWASELEYDIAIGDVVSYNDPVLNMIGVDNDGTDLADEAFYADSDFVNGYDYFNSNVLGLSDLDIMEDGAYVQDPVDDNDYQRAVVVYDSNSGNDLYYTLVWNVVVPAP